MHKELEQFYADNRDLLLKRLYHRAGSMENAEDVLQEAFVKALTYIDSFNPDSQKLGAWFNTIMNNALKDFKTDERNGGMTRTVEWTEDMAETYEMDYSDSQLCKTIEKEISTKKPEVKQALHLYFFRQYKTKEISHIVDLNFKQITMIIHRFKADMNSKYGELFT